MYAPVGIIGAGPAGLLLSHLLHLQGIQSWVLEARSRDHVERRVRAGVLEQPTVDLLHEVGLGHRLAAEGLRHEGTRLRFAGTTHRIDFAELTGGRAVTVYGQQEVVKDLIAARLVAGATLLFDAPATATAGLDSARPSVRYTLDGTARTAECDFLVGADGFHGISRAAIPAHRLTVYERAYPYAWLGILARSSPAGDELIYARHDRGFALHSMRTPEITRQYLQVDPDDSVDAWPDDRIWAELEQRFAAPGFTLGRGPIMDKGITPMRGFVVEPLRYGRLFLAGDAAHIVPPTGAKGMNLAIADVRLLAHALGGFYADGREDLLDAYSETALRRVWRAEYFSWWMTSMLHRAPGGDAFGERLAYAQLEHVATSRAAATSLAENYVGLSADRPWAYRL
ncbi:4-hydroxybenzoate 3-monooxygenase [Allonocardiopsis opalescens]|uniref:p-hydroxybenzoate 3-monooxygenase n=1 Tax=Allonocardiopsis opalescens TaxID=1144618 RepID=A0A2T0Q7N3_9ACTN|nr:4-hydroxybenzoate 3-monooxygenase [Allonocardiopsis opalescens]PRX99850.1 p-hydroxybenzoate 3-monooxygenase [Allonocardiopsis opalescens]